MKRVMGLYCSFKDNGVGFNKNLEDLKTTSLGMRIVESLINKDLGGSFDIEKIINSRGRIAGTVVKLTLGNQ